MILIWQYGRHLEVTLKADQMVYRVLTRCAVSSSHRKVKISDFEENRLFFERQRFSIDLKVVLKILGWPNLTLKDHKMIESYRLDRIG